MGWVCRLVRVLVDFFDANELRAVVPNYVDGSVRLIEPNRSFAFALTFERFVMEPGHLAYVLDAIKLDEPYPRRELALNLLRHAAQLLGSPLCNLDPLDHWLSVYVTTTYMASRP
jgi:hypothetical protein